MPDTHMFIVWVSLVIRVMQIKPTMWCDYTPSRMPKNKRPESTKWWQGSGAPGTLTHCQSVGTPSLEKHALDS